MHPNDAGFLLSDIGKRLAADSSFLAQGPGLDANLDIVSYAIKHRGFVFIGRVRRAIFVELDPSKVAPLAALEAFYQVKATAVECVVLAYPGDSWKRPRYELLCSREAALERMEKVARAASRRVAAGLQTRAGAPCPVSVHDRAWPRSPFSDGANRPPSHI
jgi:hypothetical protein